MDELFRLQVSQLMQQANSPEHYEILLTEVIHQLKLDIPDLLIEDIEVGATQYRDALLLVVKAKNIFSEL